MKVEHHFFQFYEFVLFLVSFVMHTAKVLMPLSDFKALQTSVFRRKYDKKRSTKFAIVYKRKQQFFTLLIWQHN
jgi:hypothetical protein